MKRFAFIAGLVALFVGLVAMPGSAASFDDTNPCPASGPLLVCPAGQVGQPYSLQLRALAGCDNYRWEIVNGALPSQSLVSSAMIVLRAVVVPVLFTSLYQPPPLLSGARLSTIVTFRRSMETSFPTR